MMILNNVLQVKGIKTHEWRTKVVKNKDLPLIPHEALFKPEPNKLKVLKFGGSESEGLILCEGLK